jgi:TPR repeat protein
MNNIVPVDPLKAISLYKQVEEINKNYKKVNYALGRCYENGVGVGMIVIENDKP